jgi:hypothetical protein
MPCKCVECGGKTDCDSIICTDCLADIIEKINTKHSSVSIVNSNKPVEVK